jgi:RNA polymerase sigma factor (sigma-70 family)
MAHPSQFEHRPNEELQELFLANLPGIKRMLGFLASRKGLDREEAEDFASWAQLRIIENDYGLLRKFRGESTVLTYVTAAIRMAFHDYRVQEWGRFRCSAKARRLGPLAMKLEILLARDGLTLSQAITMLKANGDITLSDRELAALAAKLPRRTPMRPVQSVDHPVDAPIKVTPEDDLRRKETELAAESARAALRQALASLPPEDSLLMKLCYLEGLRIADIAKALHLEQKPLYKRRDTIKEQLRLMLEAAGITDELIRDIIEDDDDDSE